MEEQCKNKTENKEVRHNIYKKRWITSIIWTLFFNKTKYWTINKLIDWCLMPTLAMFQLYRGSIKRWQLYVYLENKEYFKNGAFVYINVSFHNINKIK
jgi:hypothetical protein